MRLSVVIPTWNGRERLQRCLESLRAQTRPPDAIIVVDDGSTDGTVTMLGAAHPEVRIVALPVNGGFCRAINAGLRAAETEAVMTLNNDMTLAPDCLERLMAAWTPECIAGPLVLFESDHAVVYAAGDRLLVNGRPESIGFRQPASAMPDADTIAGITAGAAIYPRALFERIGYFEEQFVAYFDDMELSLRARRAGIEPRLVPGAVAYHEGAASIHDRTWWRTRQCARNHLALVLMHWPSELLWHHGPAIVGESLAGMRRTFDAVRCERGALRAAMSVAGLWVAWCSLVPYALRERRRIASHLPVSVQAFAQWLSKPESAP